MIDNDYIHNEQRRKKDQNESMSAISQKVKIDPVETEDERNEDSTTTLRLWNGKICRILYIICWCTLTFHW